MSVRCHDGGDDDAKKRGMEMDYSELARDEAQEGSDVYLLVVFSQPAGIFEFIRLKHFLEEVLDAPVDLATPEALKKQLRERILKEAVRAA